MTSTLAVLVDGRQAGTVSEEAGRLTLSYADGWRAGRAAIPLSLSLPLSRHDHPDLAVRSFLWGLLPDNEQVLERWAREHQVSARNPFALLRHVGDDCAGAVQLIAPDRVAAITAGEGGVNWIDEATIAERIRILRRDPTAWHLSSTGQFSLAGAQAKTALHFDRTTGRWGDPWGADPTTHILKPAVAGFDDHDLNEHLCLETARHLGLVTARSEVRTFAGERVIVVQRYDRIVAQSGRVARLHQEDMCQALSRPPGEKYQNEGGPTAEEIIELLRQSIDPAKAAAAAVAAFVDALAVNWIIVGTDAHAKNYSILLTSRQVRLAPIYDVASALPYDDMYLPKLKLAMRIGGEYRAERITGRHWRKFAELNRLDPEATVDRVRDLVAGTPAALARAVAAEAVQAIGSTLPARLTDRLAVRTRWCARALDHT